MVVMLCRFLALQDFIAQQAPLHLLFVLLDIIVHPSQQ
jgi:hypothetical protein